eukprot:3159663-Pleurochrysis_carterae.AAC.1
MLDAENGSSQCGDAHFVCLLHGCGQWQSYYLMTISLIACLCIPYPHTTQIDVCLVTAAAASVDRASQ